MEILPLDICDIEPPIYETLGSPGCVSKCLECAHSVSLVLLTHHRSELCDQLGVLDQLMWFGGTQSAQKCAAVELPEGRPKIADP